MIRYGMLVVLALVLAGCAAGESTVRIKGQSDTEISVETR